MAKFCKKCGKLNENPLLKLCREHYYEEQLNNPKQKKFYEIKRTAIKKISDKKKKRLKEYWSEVELFKKVFSKNKNCVICWKWFKSFEDTKTWCYAHILSKKNYPHLRYFINNIAFVCSIEHHNEVDKCIAWTNKKELERKILAWNTIDFTNCKKS